MATDVRQIPLKPLPADARQKPLETQSADPELEQLFKEQRHTLFLLVNSVYLSMVTAGSTTMYTISRFSSAAPKLPSIEVLKGMAYGKSAIAAAAVLGGFTGFSAGQLLNSFFNSIGVYLQMDRRVNLRSLPNETPAESQYRSGAWYYSKD